MLRLLPVLSLTFMVTSAALIEDALKCIQQYPGKQDCANCMVSVMLSYREYGYSDNVDDCVEILIADPTVKAAITDQAWEINEELYNIYMYSNIINELMYG